jgi:hypothetical protein
MIVLLQKEKKMLKILTHSIGLSLVGQLVDIILALSTNAIFKILLNIKNGV